MQPFIGPFCPNCEGNLQDRDSGQPDHVGGWYCPDCNEWWSDAEYAELCNQALIDDEEKDRAINSTYDPTQDDESEAQS